MGNFDIVQRRKSCHDPAAVSVQQVFAYFDFDWIISQSCNSIVCRAFSAKLCWQVTQWYAESSLTSLEIHCHQSMSLSCCLPTAKTCVVTTCWPKATPCLLTTMKWREPSPWTSTSREATSTGLMSRRSRLRGERSLLGCIDKFPYPWRWTNSCLEQWYAPMHIVGGEKKNINIWCLFLAHPPTPRVSWWKCFCVLSDG